MPRRNYSYYGSRRSNNKLKIAGIIALVVVIIGATVFLNFNRIRALVKGYTFGQASQIVGMTSEEESAILSVDRLENFDTWYTLEATPLNYIDYEKFYAINDAMAVEEVVEYVDELNGDIASKLAALGYLEDDIWSMIEDGASISDFAYLIDNSLSAASTAPYRLENGYVIKNMEQYIQANSTYNDTTYTVGIVNYPFLLSTNDYNGRGYTITNPENILTLVKTGFYLESSYEPADLVVSPIPIAPDCENTMLRQEAADALMEMYQDAKAEGMNLVFNSGYRSYAVQSQTYQDFENRYGGIYASEYVALPGASEHQTGLGVDLTSQSVVDGTRITFGDTPEFKWCLEHSAQYGYINRYSEETSELTGIAHEPWHFRYVGVEVAQKVTDVNITFEEYCLRNGILPDVVAR